MSNGGGEPAAGWGGYVRAAARYATSYTQPDGTTREPGTRRRKLLQAASDLRQSYYAGYMSNPGDSTGGRPEMGSISGNNQELWLFPSYAREIPEDERKSWWMEQLERGAFDDEAGSNNGYRHDTDYEGEDNIVEVDVRGWVFAPRTGPLSRKDRFQTSAIRWMCGLSAQAPAQLEDGDTTPSLGQTGFAFERQDFSQSRSESGTNFSGGGWRSALWRSGTMETPQTTMTPAELRAANATFDERLAPFTHQPVPRAPVTVFFYSMLNDTQAQSRVPYTAEDGHFMVRAKLPFIPTHVRVLASETLSATEEIKIFKPKGVSIISDIDDTVKHSGISIGPREMARAAFTMSTREILIPGVADWYRSLTKPPYNVSLHYISNSPWQLYPVLRSFFDEAGLPSGSFHLKQYNGMLQGILEPAAERKKGTVERVIRDFPHQKWLLIGDSGEADLEVYTEMADQWPDRILAICIRDVTSHPSREYSVFTGNALHLHPMSSDPSLRGPPPVPPKLRNRALSNLSDDSAPLPPPRPIPRAVPHRNDTPISSVSPSMSNLSTHSTPPSRPGKPASLRSPPVPKKPANLQAHPPAHSSANPEAGHSGHEGQGSERSPPPPPPPPRRGTATSRPEDLLIPPIVPRRIATAAPTMEEARTAGPPRPLQRVLTSTGGVGPGAEMPPLTKRQAEWERRWAMARERLDLQGVRLLYWRVGTDLKDLTMQIVGRELGVPLRGSGTRWVKS